VEALVAEILRGMGYRKRISPKGPDRGVDVIASLPYLVSYERLLRVRH
jgi:predicted Mrr-cat superfamily restriction endonuclease